MHRCCGSSRGFKGIVLYLVQTDCGRMSSLSLDDDFKNLGAELGSLSKLLEENLEDVVFPSFGNTEVEAEVVTSGLSQFYVPNPLATSMFPSTEEFEGDFQFELEMNGQHAGKDWLYSHKLNKLFVNIMKPIFVEVKCKPMKQQLFVRAVLVFLGTEYFHDPVVRCLQHAPATIPANKGYETIIDHVIRSEHPGVIYDYNTISKRFSVVVPLEEPQPGSSSVLISYMFTCKNSCPGGMNRRATQLIFTLEDQAQNIYGRKCIEVRICSCPKRDKTKEESDNKGPTRCKRPMTEAPVMPTKKQALDEIVQVEIPARMYRSITGSIYSTLCMEIQNEKRQPTPNEKKLLRKYKFSPIDVD